MKNYLNLFLLLLLVFVISACGSSNEDSNSNSSDNSDSTKETSSEEKVVFGLGHATSEENIWHKAMAHFAEKVDEYSNGSMEIEIFANAQLGNDLDMIDSVQNGVLDMSYNAVASFEAYTPVFLGFQLPFLIEDYEMSNEVVKSDVASKALKELEEFNMKGLVMIENGMRVPGTTTKPLATVEDFKGLKMRAAESGINLDIFQMLGADPTPIAYPEVYPALQTGVIDGQDQYLSTWVQDNFWEVIDHLSLTNMYTWQGIISVNLDKYNSLSEEQQEILQKAALDAQKFNYERMDQYDKEAIEFLEDKGIEIVKDIDLAPFQERLSPLYEKYADKHPLVEEVIELIGNIKK